MCEVAALSDVSGSFLIRRMDSAEAGFKGTESETWGVGGGGGCPILT